MLIDVVIPYRLSPFTSSLELRYCLRGVQQHLQDVGRVWLIGEHPNYINSANVSTIAVTETNWYEHLTRNIHYKILTACNNPDVSDPFLYMNDDHFILQDTKAVDIPYYHTGTHWVTKGKYHVTVRNTLDKFPGARNFDIHVPMLVYKDFYRDSVGGLNWKTPFGYCIKTSYCNALTIVGEYYPDYKIDHKPTQSDFDKILERKFFSVGDKAITPEMISFLKEHYPHQSIYEI
jgi:hypothetical protein